jgi:hypothetical protein
MKYKANTGIILALLLTGILTLAFHIWNLPTAQAEKTDVVFEFSEVVKPSNDTRELAVAFHSLNFLDADANSTGELLFGTPEANTLQEEGWFDNEEWPGVGTFQWAGGSSKKASMQLSIPEGTEGLLLNITSIVDSMRMNVTIGEELVAKLQVYEYWHPEYVPVEEVAHDPTPEEEPEWVEGRYFPEFPTTDQVYVIRVPTDLEDGTKSWQPDWRIYHSNETMTALTIVGMQGVINRNGPKVYLNWEGFEMGRAANFSQFWLTQLSQHIDTVKIGLEGLEAVNFLFQRYGSLFNGSVIYDPDVPDTINLATMLAGLENRVILAPQQLGLPGIPDFDSVTDLRTLVEEQGWNTTEEGKHKLYEWVYNNLWPQLEHRIIGVISPGPPTAYSTSDYFPLCLAARDYLIALRLTALWISPSEEPQASLFAQFLDDAPSPIPISGFYAADESGTVDLAAKYGDCVPVFTNGNGPLDCGSLTVFSSVRPEIIPYESNISIDRLFATLGDKPAITMWTSDGDAIMLLTSVSYKWGRFWDYAPNRLYGASINPMMIDLAPVVWNYYTQGNSTLARGLMTGSSGVGYTVPYYMNDTQLEAYLEYTSRYMNETGLRSAWRWRPWINDTYGYESLEHDFDLKYYEALSDIDYLGSFVGYGSDGRFGSGFAFMGVPTPTVPPAYFLDNTANGSWIVEDLLKRKSGEVFMDLESYIQEGWGYTSGEVIQDEDALGGKAVLFPKDNPYRGLVVMGPAAILAPGNYTTTYRLKVPDNQDGVGEFAHLLVVHNHNETHQRVLAQQFILPNNFSQAMEYQNFTLEFSLDQFATSVDFLLSYNAGSSGNDSAYVDLFADYILTTREESTGLPKFSSILVSGWWEPLAIFLAEKFELAGVVVLHPDEFLAALNPEFMIEWATPILGSEHPALDEARQQLVESNFLASLITIREALRMLPEHTYLLDFEEKSVNYTVSIRGNTWITPLEYDETGHQIKFSTHGPPEGTIQAFVTLPNELQDGLNVVNIDNQPHPFTSSQNETHTTINIQFDQGPHSVEISLSALAPPNIANVSQSPLAGNVLPEDEVKINATVVDPNGVKRVVLNYTYANTSGTWTSVVNMTNLEGNVWNAAIPAFPYGTNITYRIIAEDNMNNTITTEDLGYEYQYIVIPEFPSFLILSLFMITTLLTVIVYRRKHSV